MAVQEKPKAGAYIQTFTNKKFHVLDPQESEIDIYDIAHALALQCRFTGHTRFHYSIGQHVVLASHLVPPAYAFEALHHDDSEAYICDMSRPLKHFTPAGAAYLEVEAPIQHACNKKFGIYPAFGEMSPEVKKADNLMLYAEKEQLMPPMEWDTRWGDGLAAPVKLYPWPHWYAEMRFLHRHWQLTGDSHYAFMKTANWLLRKVFS